MRRIRPRSFVRAASVVAFLAMGACLGNLGPNATAVEGSSEEGTLGPNGDLGNEGGGVALDGTAIVSGPTTPSPVQMRRLIKREVLQAYNDLVGPTPSLQASVLVDDVGGSGYDNDVTAQNVTKERTEGYLTAASQAANDVLTSAKAVKFLGCKTRTVNRDCMNTFVPAFGLRVYRRPLTNDEVTAYLNLFASESDPVLGARQVVRAFLCAPSFLFQPEVGVAANDKPGLVKLTGYERATRLSFLLAGSSPSDDLLARAKSGELDDPEGVATAARKILATARGKAYLRQFMINWFGLHGQFPLADAQQATSDPNAQLLLDMPEETLLLFDDFVAPGKKIANMLAANYTYVSPALAKIYGVDAPAKGTWQKIPLDGVVRLGLLTQPAVLRLASTGGPAPIVRGRFVRQTLLCQTIGGPPAGAGTLVPDKNNPPTSERAAFAAHSASPSCSVCHNMMDSIGFGMEKYAADGTLRNQDTYGNSLTGEGEVRGENGFRFVGPADLGLQLAESAQINDCVARRLAQYLLGHALTDDDADTVTLLKANLGNGGFAAAVIAFVSADAFLYRKNV